MGEVTLTSALTPNGVSPQRAAFASGLSVRWRLGCRRVSKGPSGTSCRMRSATGSNRQRADYHDAFDHGGDLATGRGRAADRRPLFPGGEPIVLGGFAPMGPIPKGTPIFPSQSSWRPQTDSQHLPATWRPLTLRRRTGRARPGRRADRHPECDCQPRLLRRAAERGTAADS